MTSPFAGLPRSFLLLLGALLVNATAAVLPFLLLFLVLGRGLSAAAAGLLVGLAGAADAAAQPLGGMLADRVGPRRVLVVTPLLGAVCIGLLWNAHGTGQLAAAAVLVNLVNGLFRPTAAASVAALVPGDAQPQAYALQMWISNLGFVSSALLAGACAEGHFALLFVLDAGSAVLCGLLMLLLPRSLDTAGRSGDAAQRRGIGRALRHRRLIALAGLVAFFTLGIGQLFTIFALAMTARGLSTGEYGAVIASNGVLIVVLVQPFAVPYLSRCRTSRLMAGGTGLLAVGLAMTGLARSLVGFELAVIVMTVGEIASAVAGRIQVTRLAPHGWTGRYLGVFALGASVGVALGPPIGGALYGAVGHLAWYALAVVVAVGACGYLLLGEGPVLESASPQPVGAHA